MIFWAVSATLAAAAALIFLLAYKRQIKLTRKELEFMKSHSTNLRLTSSLPFSDLCGLIDSINGEIDRARLMRDRARANEESLKETVTNLSHDIRTPLTSLDGYFQLLAEAATEEERRHYTEMIQSRISSLKELLEELFTFAKLQDESYMPTAEPTDFSKCVYDCTFSFYDDFRKRSIEPEIDFTEEKLTVNGNAEALKRAVQNIIKNALEHGKEHIRLTLEEKDGNAVFRCSNDTENPQDIDISKVFSRFYKADPARTHTSTGLGLSIAKGLAEKSGGSITADIDGNTFTVELMFRILKN